MKKIFYCLFSITIFSLTSFSQWTSNYWQYNSGDNPLTEAQGLKVTIDEYANCYVAGYTVNENSDEDMLVIKYNSQGDTLWVRSYNGNGNSDDRAFGISVDNSGNVYITGTLNLYGKSYELALLKYDSNGELQWASTYGATTSNLEDKGLGIVTDDNGGIYVTGYCTDYDGNTDLLTIKYDSNGELLWDVREDGDDNLDAQGFGIVTDNSGNIIVTGYCRSYYGNDDIILVKYDSSGTPLNRQFYYGNGGGEDRGFGIAVDESDNIYITGYVTDSVNGTDCVVLKYNSSDSLVWDNTYNGDADSNDKTFGIAVDASNNVYVTGHCTNSSSMMDYITIKYDTDGNGQWVALYNGPINGDDKANAIALLCNGESVVVTGASWGNNDNNDYATIKYDAADGNELVASRYSMNGNSDDVANDVASNNGCLAAVTGYSELIIESHHNSSAVSTMMINFGEGSELTTNNNNPQQYKLHQNYPNPFNPSTTIKFEIAKNSAVKLIIYDMLGREVNTLVNQQMKAGSYNINFTTTNLASGIYFYRLSADGFQDVKKMSFIK